MNTMQIHEGAAQEKNDYRILKGENKKSIALVSKPTADAGYLQMKVYPEELSYEKNKIKLENKFQAEDFEACSIEFLIDHIINKHHKISRENAVIIHDLAQVVAYEDGRISPETKELVSSLFLCLHDYLNILKKEEEILFPNICLLIRNNAKSERGQYPTFGFINHWIKEIKQDHETMAEYFRVFYKITNDYLLPGDASSSHRALFAKLREFEMDFILHSYFENNILFPRTIGEDEHCSEEK